MLLDITDAVRASIAAVVENDRSSIGKDSTDTLHCVPSRHIGQGVRVETDGFEFEVDLQGLEGARVVAPATLLEYLCLDIGVGGGGPILQQLNMPIPSCLSRIPMPLMLHCIRRLVADN